MSNKSEHWAFPRSLQPRPDEVTFDLERAMSAVVGLRAEIPDDAFTASILGTERTGNGIVIDDNGLVLTIGYLITEAETIWLTTNAGDVVAGHALAYDFTTGFGLVQPLGSLRAPSLVIGDADGIDVADDVVVVGHGGRTHALKAQVFAKREFAGYWEYVLDEALFVTPAHPEWSGAALLDSDGTLIGVGSLFVQEAEGDETVQGNMFVPTSLLTPILEDLKRNGRSTGAPRPWLGMYTGDDNGRLTVGDLATGGPAEKAGIAEGDVIVEVAGERITSLAQMFRAIWRVGPAGVEIPLTVARGSTLLRIGVRSAERQSYFRKPSLQ
jgi:S1-C subfamily serine protease